MKTRTDTPEHSVAGNSKTTERPAAAASFAAKPEASTPDNLTRDIAEGLGLAAKPEFGGFDQLRNLFQIPRSTAYELEQAGEIRFVRLRKRGRLRARVLVDLDSVRRYLDRCRDEKPGPAVPRKDDAK